MKKSAIQLDLPVFKKRIEEEDVGSFTDDFAPGFYIGQVNPITGKKEGLGVRIYLSEKPSPQDERIPPEKIVAVYEGEWQAEMREGKGLEVYANKDIYLGLFHWNQRQGKGKLLKHATGETYTGEWF